MSNGNVNKDGSQNSQEKVSEAESNNKSQGNSEELVSDSEHDAAIERLKGTRNRLEAYFEENRGFQKKEVVTHSAIHNDESTTTFIKTSQMQIEKGRQSMNSTDVTTSDFDVVSILSKEPEVQSARCSYEALNSFYEKYRSLHPPSSSRTRQWDESLKTFQSRRERKSITIVPQEMDIQRGLSTTTVEIADLRGADKSIASYCNVCNRYVQTLITYEYGFLTYVAFACSVLCPIFILCAWVPFLFTNFMDVRHSCPICGTDIGIYRRM